MNMPNNRLSSILNGSFSSILNGSFYFTHTYKKKICRCDCVRLKCTLNRQIVAKVSNRWNPLSHAFCYRHLIKSSMHTIFIFKRSWFLFSSFQQRHNPKSMGMWIGINSSNMHFFFLLFFMLTFSCIMVSQTREN
jgi:hypothetical protein